jgi:hypothetical protein
VRWLYAVLQKYEGGSDWVGTGQEKDGTTLERTTQEGRSEEERRKNRVEMMEGRGFGLYI